MLDKPLGQEQSDMRKRWADPVYRMQYGLLKGTITSAEFSVGVLNFNAEELHSKIEEAYNIHVGHKQVIP